MSAIVVTGPGTLGMTQITQYPFDAGVAASLRVRVPWRPIRYAIVADMEAYQAGKKAPAGWYFFKAAIEYWDIWPNGRTKPYNPKYYDNLGVGPFKSYEAAWAGAIFDGLIPFRFTDPKVIPPFDFQVIQDMTGPPFPVIVSECEP